MKFRITLKDPDGVYESVRDFIENDLHDNELSLSVNEKSDVAASRILEINERISRWFQYQEYLTLEIDLENNTCVVIPVK